MTDRNYNPVADAEFRTTTNLEIKHLYVQVDLLWKRQAKQREETQAVSRRINGIAWTLVAALAGMLVSILRVKVGL